MFTNVYVVECLRAHPQLCAICFRSLDVLLCLKATDSVLLVFSTHPPDLHLFSQTQFSASVSAAAPALVLVFLF